MADQPKTTREALQAQLEAAFAESQQMRDVVRDAVRNATNAIAVRTGNPVHPGAIIAALMTEAGTVCALWGMSLQKRPEEIEDFFQSALRNARQGFRLELQQLLRGQHPIAAPGGQTH